MQHNCAMSMLIHRWWFCPESEASRHRRKSHSLRLRPWWPWQPKVHRPAPWKRSQGSKCISGLESWKIGAAARDFSTGRIHGDTWSEIAWQKVWQWHDSFCDWAVSGVTFFLICDSVCVFVYVTIGCGNQLQNAVVNHGWLSPFPRQVAPAGNERPWDGKSRHRIAENGFANWFTNGKSGKINGKSMENHGTSAKMMILGMILGMILEKYYCEHDDSLIFFSAGVLPN